MKHLCSLLMIGVLAAACRGFKETPPAGAGPPPLAPQAGVGAHSAIVAHDESSIYLVRQPREAVSEGALLELPAGKLDVPGEERLECAKRELAEEVGKAAAEWRFRPAMRRGQPVPVLVTMEIAFALR